MKGDLALMYDGPFSLYFAGTGTTQAREKIRELSCDQLLSQLNERSAIRGWVKYLEEHPECHSKLFVDSGAWTAYTKGTDIDVDEYTDFANEVGEHVTVFAAVDKIPGQFGKPVTDEDRAAAPEISWNNYIQMVNRIKPEYRDKVLPTFHYGEDFKYLRQILEYKFEDGGQVAYMGLGAIADLDSASDRYNWFEECFKVIKNSSNPNIKVHAFGMTALNILKDFPFASADSTTWVMCSSHGSIIVKDKKIRVGSKSWTKPDSIFNKNPAVKEEVEKVIKDRGYTLEQLSEDYIARATFNVLSLKEWVDSYQYVPKQHTVKKDLWGMHSR